MFKMRKLYGLNSKNNVPFEKFREESVLTEQKTIHEWLGHVNYEGVPKAGIDSETTATWISDDTQATISRNRQICLTTLLPESPGWMLP